MVELLLGLVIIVVCWIGIAELCRRNMTWPKGHPGATYGISFFLVFLFFAWIGNMDEIEEQGIDPPAPDLAEQGIETPAPDLAEQGIGNPAGGLAEQGIETPTPDPSEQDLENKAQALDQAFKRDRENKAPAKGGLFANLTAGLAKMEAIENMGNPAASEAVERELDPAIADMNCGELQILLDKAGDETLIARRAFWTENNKWKAAKNQAMRDAETDDAAWGRFEIMEAATAELSRQWWRKDEKAGWIAAAMTDKGCCDTGEPLSILNECHFAYGPEYSNKPLKLLGREAAKRRAAEKQEAARQAAIEQAHGPAIAGLSCAEARQYERQAKAANDSLARAKLAAEQAHNDAERQAEKEGVSDEGEWGQIVKLKAFAKEQEARFENHSEEYDFIALAVDCKEAACDLQAGGGRNAMAESRCKNFRWQGETLDTWSGEVYQQ